MSRRGRAIVISNDEPDSSYGARRLESAFRERFDTELVDPLGGFDDASTWIARSGLDALVLSGSDRSVLSELPWMLEEEAILRAAVEDRVPTLAVCFGHQLLGKAFGSEIVTRPKRVGLFEIEAVTEDPIFPPLGRPPVVPEQHSEHVCEVPPGFTLIATSDYCHVQAMRHALAPVYGIQFHPCYDDRVFDVDETWKDLEVERPLRHDGAAILRRIVSVLADHPSQ